MTNQQLKAILMAMMCSNGNNVIHNKLVISNLAANADNIINEANKCGECTLEFGAASTKP